MAAGLEGGSKRRIESEWSLDDYGRIRDFWAENGPPLNIAALMIAKSLGVDLIGAGKPESEFGEIEPDPDMGPSIADLAAQIQAPRGDTLAASREVIRLLRPEGTA